jgi:alkylhydroperoxidase family enzyme
MSVRSAVALEDGADEQLLAKVDTYESSDLSDAQKAALRLADAYLGAGPQLDEAGRTEILRQLTVPQVVETVLKLMQWSSDKTIVALRLDLDDVSIIPFGPAGASR